MLASEEDHHHQYDQQQCNCLSGGQSAEKKKVADVHSAVGVSLQIAIIEIEQVHGCKRVS